MQGQLSKNSNTVQIGALAASVVIMIGLLVFIQSSKGTNGFQRSVLQDFSGTYYLGDGMGVNWSLSIHINSTFTLIRGTDMGGYDQHEGSITFAQNQLQLYPSTREFFMTVEPFEPLVPQRVLTLSRLEQEEIHNLIPVRWGARRYLVFASRISDFCQGEPRSMSIHSDIYLREGDWEIQVDGEPTTLDGSVVCP